jgi:2-polyprenyl-3-methyl-5-hydroxy-6-metoxy-1,4-benzoquinol methylase
MKTKNSEVNWDTYYAYHVPVSDRDRLLAKWRGHSNFYRQWLLYIHRIVPIYKKGLRFFEIGSGVGGVLALLADHGAVVEGSDISKRAVTVGKMLNPSVEYRQFNVQTMRLPDARYDRIMAFEVLEHLDKLDHSISNIRHGLKRGGNFIGTTPYPYEKHVTAPTHINVLHPAHWKQLFLKNGFSSVHTYPMSLPPFLWRIHPVLNIIFPVYVPFPKWISTTLIVAKK